MDSKLLLEKSDREKQIDNFLKQIESQEEYEENIKKKINKFYKNYTDELEDYEYIKDLKTFNKIKQGGYIRYFNLNDELKWGGILIKKIKQNDMDLMVLSNTNCKRFVVSFQKNYIFYKNHQTASDKTRKLFMSALEKYTENN
jgi:hypothetical protein